MSTVIFDMDGVIVDSELHWVGIENTFLNDLVGTWTEDDQERILGMSATDIFKLLVSEYGLKRSWEEYMAHYRELAQIIYGERSNLIGSVAEVIRELSSNGHTIGLASSSPRGWIDIVVDRFLIRDQFRAIVSSEDVGGVGKPAPDIYLHCIKSLDHAIAAPPIAIEDTDKGIRSAKAAGCYVFGFRNGFNPKQQLTEADQTLSGWNAESIDCLRKILTEC